MQKRTKRILYTAAVCILAAAVTVVCVIMNKNSKTALASVDGNKIYADEMKYYILKERASVIQKFSQNGADVSDKEFWNKPHEGLIPAESLAERAFESLRRDKALFSESAKRGLSEKLDFEKINENMQAENKARADALKEGSPVYGVSEYTIETYFDYLKSNLEIKLREQLAAEKLFNADELALKQFYGEIKDTDPLFKTKTGEYKPYSEVHAKVKYLYEEKCYSDYIEKLANSQKITRDDAAILQLVTETV